MTAIQRPVPFRHRLTGGQGRLVGLTALVIAIIAGAVIGGIVLTRDDAATPASPPAVERPPAVEPPRPLPASMPAPTFAYIVGSRAEAEELARSFAEANTIRGAIDAAPDANPIFIASSDLAADFFKQQLFADANMVGRPVQVVDLRKN